MKIIYPNVAEPLSCNVPSEADFPLAHLSSPHKLESFKASGALGGAVEVELFLSGPSEALALFGMNADQVTVRIYADEAKSDLRHEETFNGQTSDSFGSYAQDSVWVEYDLLPFAWAQLSFACTSEPNPSVGVVSAGLLHRFPNPSWGFEEEWNDASVVKQLRVGAKYTKRKAHARKYSGGLEFFHAQNGRADFEALKRFRGAVGPQPFACLPVAGLSDGLGGTLDAKYRLWGSFTQFKSVLGRRSHSTVALGLEEYL